MRDENLRSKVTLFDQQQDEFDEDKDMKIRGKLIKQQYFKLQKDERIKVDMVRLTQSRQQLAKRTSMFSPTSSIRSSNDRPLTTT